jgi:hypothetical protein
MPEANGPSSEMPTATSKKIASAFVALRRGGSGTFAAVLIGVGAGWYCRNSPKPQRQAELASMSDVANDTERRQAPSLLPFAFLVAYATTVAFFLGSVELFGVGPAVKSRRRKPAQQIVRRLKVCGFRVVNHARSIAELISVPLTDDHFDL